VARLPKVTQKVDCTMPGYEDSGIFIRVWVNAPQRVLDEWMDKKKSALVVGEDGRPELEMDPETGDPVVDPDTYRPVQKVDADKVKESGMFFLRSLVTEFSLTEDMEGNPLSLDDEDFFERIPQDLIKWLYDAVSEAMGDRRKQGKESVRLAETIGQRYEAA
jgi:hypothetical protein